jgi:phosphonate transport system ATP-binding protein
MAGELRAARSRIGMLPQDLGLVGNLRVVQNVILGRSGRRHLPGTIRDLLWPRRTDREEIFALLERMGVAAKMYDRTDSLSGGQRQRVAMARLLYQGAEIVLADEPLSAVDPARGRDVLTRLTEVAGESTTTLVASLHQVKLAREFFPRLIGLKAGAVVFDGQPDDPALDELYEL